MGQRESMASVTRTSGIAVRSAMRRVVLNEELTILIGPAADGALLDVGVLGLEGDDPVVIHALHLRQTFYRFLG